MNDREEDGQSYVVTAVNIPAYVEHWQVRSDLI